MNIKVNLKYMYFLSYVKIISQTANDQSHLLNQSQKSNKSCAATYRPLNDSGIKLIDLRELSSIQYQKNRTDDMVKKHPNLRHMTCENFQAHEK